MPDSPLVSVIMCVYNAGAYLRPAVQSVLAQTYRNIELLMVDDGSTDGCMETIADLQDPRIRVIRQPNRGKPAAMNVALEQMRGEYYALNDADDLSLPRRIEVQLAAMQQNPALAAVYCGHELLLDGKVTAPTSRAKGVKECREDVIKRFRMPAHDPTGMYRMSLVGDLRYAEDLLQGEGFDYMLRVGEKFEMTVCGECLYTYRVHSDSITRRNFMQRHDMVCTVLRRACERRGLRFCEHFADLAELRPDRSNRALDNNLAAQFIESSCDLAREGQRFQAIRVGVDCMRLHPLDWHYHKALLCAISPLWLVRRMRRLNKEGSR